MKTTLVMFMALLGASANAAQPSDTSTMHDDTLGTAADADETCEESKTMSQTSQTDTKPLGCGWAEHRTTTAFEACPRCGGEVSNCWVRDGDGPELMTWACVQRTEPRLTFGAALERLKSGDRVAREGWNGKGMWLVLIKPGNAMHRSSAGVYDMKPCIGMKTAQGDMQPGWLASQADMLADDWVVVTS